MKKIIVFCVAFLATMSLWASETSVKNAYGVEIWYDFDNESTTASVTYKGFSSSEYYDEYTGEVVIPSTVTYGGEEYSVKTIGDEAFYGCRSLTSITLPESVTEIGKSAFYGCSSLTSITLPESVTSIGSYAFYGCSSLTSIDVAPNNENYASIDGVLFSKDKTILIQYPEGKATSYVIPDGVTEIGDRAFYGCSSLTSITLPESVTEIGERAFCDCSSLTSITLPESVTEIGMWAFCDCSSLTSITLPEGVTEIEYNAFDGCSSLTIIDVASNNNNYTSIDGVLFSKDKTILIQYPEGKDATSCIIPEGVTTIGNHAFWYCNSLTSITIPESVTEIASSAFNGCSSLTSITIPEGVTEIASGAFYHCSSLTSITIPEGVTEIGWDAFSGCSSLTSITCKNTTPPEVDHYTYTFENVDKSIPLYVPKQSVEAYKNAEGWKEFTNIQAIPSSSVANAKAETQDSVHKEYRDGQVLIIKGDKTYTMFGTEY